MLSSVTRIVALLVLSLLAFEATAQSVPSWARSSNGTAAQAPDARTAPPAECETLSGCSLAPPPVPIDGGLSLLAFAGGAYAIRRLRKNRKDGDESDE